METQIQNQLLLEMFTLLKEQNQELKKQLEITNSKLEITNNELEILKEKFGDYTRKPNFGHKGTF